MIYDLVGVLVHSGTAESGHYYSYIRDSRPRNTIPDPKVQWYEFNDSEVKPFRIEDLDHWCFGGAELTYETVYYPEPPTKSYSAYMLFYRKRPTTAGMSPVPLERQLLPEDVVEKVQRNNDGFVRRYVYYGDDFSSFVAKMLRSMPRSETSALKDCQFADLHDHDGDLYPLQLGLQVYRHIVSHMDFKSPQEKFCSALKSAVRSSPAARHYFYTWLQKTPDCLKELLLTNLNDKARLQSAQLIASAITGDEVAKPRTFNPDNEMEVYDVEVVSTVISEIAGLVYSAGDSWRTWNEYFETLALIAKDPNWARRLIDCNMIANCAYHLLHVHITRKEAPEGFGRLKYPDNDRLRPSYKKLVTVISRLLPHVIVAPDAPDTDEPGSISDDEHNFLFHEVEVDMNPHGPRPVVLNIFVHRLFDTGCDVTDIASIVTWLLRECILRENLNRSKMAILQVLQRQADPTGMNAAEALDVVARLFSETFEAEEDMTRWRHLLHFLLKRIATWTDFVRDGFYGQEFLAFWKLVYATKDESFRSIVRQHLQILVPELMFSNEASVRERTASWAQALIPDMVEEGLADDPGVINAMNKTFYNLADIADGCLDRKVMVTEKTATFESLISPVLEILRLISITFAITQDGKDAAYTIERRNLPKSILTFRSL